MGVHRVLAAEWAALEAANKAAAARANMQGMFVDTSLSRIGFSWVPIAGSRWLVDGVGPGVIVPLQCALGLWLCIDALYDCVVSSPGDAPAQWSSV